MDEKKILKNFAKVTYEDIENTLKENSDNLDKHMDSVERKNLEAAEAARNFWVH